MTSVAPEPTHYTRAELLERWHEALDEQEALRARIKDLEERMVAALNADPSTATQALAWIGRAESAESLLKELKRYIDQRSVDRGQFPNGFVTRLEAQLKSVEILTRDQARLAERPVDDDYWTTDVDPKGRRFVVRDSSGWMRRR